MLRVMRHVLGLDLGSSSAKVGLFTLDGHCARITNVSYPTSEPQPGFREQDPRLWWDAVVSGIREVTSAVRLNDILAVGTSGHISSQTFVDRNGAPLRPALTFQDRRAWSEVEELHSDFTREELAIQLGIDLPPAASWPLPRLLWFKKHEPKTLERAHLLLQAKDSVNFRLTGEFATDASSNRGIVDFSSDTVAESVLSKLGLPAHLMPRICGPAEVIGRVCRKAASETGLPAGIPVVAGWNDLNASALGNGCVDDGDAFDITGTSDHLGVVSCVSHWVPELMCAPYLPGKRLFYGVTSNGGGSLAWYKGAFSKSVEELICLAESAPAGSDSLLFLPYLDGERSPIWDARACGAFVGIQSLHGEAHFVRAILEGVAFSLRQILDLVDQDAGNLTEPIVISGGAARSGSWNQIKANVWARPAAVTENLDSAGLGAAMLAAVAAGEYRDCETAARGMARLRARYTVDPGLAARYEQFYRVYCELYPALKNCMARLCEDRLKEAGSACLVKPQ